MSVAWTQQRMRLRFLTCSAKDESHDWFTAEQALSNAPRQAKRPFHCPKSRGMTGKDLLALSIADLQSLLRRREVSPREVIDALRERIQAVDRDIGAYLWLDIEAAVKEAEHADVDLPLGGDSDCDQRHHQRDGSTVYVRIENLARLSRALRRHGDSKIARRRRDSIWQRQTWTSSPWVRPPKIRR